MPLPAPVPDRMPLVISPVVPLLGSGLCSPVKHFPAKWKRAVTQPQSEISGMTTPFDAPDWRGMSQQDRDLGLNNGVAVAGSADMVAGWERRSADMRGAASRASRSPIWPARAQPDRLSQGRATSAPTLVFIHGGYWQTRAKEVFTLFAEGPMAHGINVALIGYTLAPDATLDEIVAEIHAGIDFSPDNCPRSAATPNRHRGVRLVRRRASDVDGAVASACQRRAWRSAASTISSRSATAISTSSSGSTKRCPAATRR